MRNIIPILLINILKILTLKNDCPKKYTCTNSFEQTKCSYKFEDIIYLKQCEIYHHCSFNSDDYDSKCEITKYEYQLSIISRWKL